MYIAVSNKIIEHDDVDIDSAYFTVQNICSFAQHVEQNKLLRCSVNASLPDLFKYIHINLSSFRPDASEIKVPMDRTHPRSFGDSREHVPRI